MNEIKLNFFQKIRYSITDIKAYRTFTKETLGKAFLYLVFFSLIFGAISSIRPIIDFNTGISSFKDSVIKNSPDFTFQDGVLSIKGNMPIVEKSDSTIVIFDTSGKTAESAIQDYSDAILVTADKIIVKQPGRTQTIELSSMEGLSFTKADVEKWLPLLKFLSILRIILGISYFFVIKIIGVLILSLIALIVNGINGTKLSYKKLLGLSIYSMTLAMLVGVLLDLMQFGFSRNEFVHFLISILIFFGISSVYIFMALNEEKDEQKRLI